MVDESSLESQISRRIERIAIILRWFHTRLIHRQQIELSIISFVKEQLVANFLNDDIPRVVAASAAHDRSQNCIGCIDIALSFGQFPDDRIVSGRHSMEDTIDPLQRFFVFHVHPIVRLVVVLQRATTKNVLPVLDPWEGKFGETRKVHLFDGDPVGANGDGSVPDFDRGLVFVSHSSLLVPTFCLAFALAFARFQLVESLHLVEPSATAHVALVLTTETTALVWRLLHASCVHQVER